MKLKSIALMAALLMAIGSMAAAQDKDKPDFSGKWKMDVAKCDFGMLPPTESESRVIEHKDPKLKMAISTKGAQGERSFESNFTTDGKEVTNTQGPREIKSTGGWDGKKIVITSKFDLQGSEIEMKDVYELAADGKGFTINRNFKSPMGEGSQTLVFAKSE